MSAFPFLVERQPRGHNGPHSHQWLVTVEPVGFNSSSPSRHDGLHQSEEDEPQHSDEKGLGFENPDDSTNNGDADHSQQHQNGQDDEFAGNSRQTIDP